MPAKTKTVRDVTVAGIQHRFTLASYWFGERWCPAVTAKGDGYQIRILAGEKQSRNFAVTTTYEYFRLDSTGLIVESPRGHAPDYNKRVRVTDIAEVAAKQAAPDEEALRTRSGF